ncbi:chemotaxis protein CheW [Algiphilus aromaticivorans]|uniref:chemotaxis protein CheW n=1 Tax=Algiphilus aromaticivorans TaxID=382454 RepID=UPI0012EB09AB|nr:chemotaxis protein CheW [Algiphilus aromaticivorans]
MQAQAVAERAIEDAEAGNASREFLTFVLGEEEYGVDILKVQEIRGYDTVTRIPEAPEFLKGVVNLRGTIVPVIDLRLKFHLSRADYDAFTVMIVLNLAERVVGVVVDRVSDVMALGSDQIFDPPEFGSTVDTAFITGLGSVEDRMLILLDIEGLMRSREMQLIDHAIQQ